MPMFDPAQMKVLLVDDTPANLDVLSSTLKPEGYQLAVAQNGAKALKIAAHFVPDLILLDVMMPEMDGFETCRRLKADALTCDIPIVFITAKSEAEDVLQGFQAGCVDYIGKPFRRQEVCARVKTHLALRATIHRLQQLNEQKNRFLGMAAHDLHSPLSGILAYTEVMELRDANMSPAERQDCLRLIGATVRRMLGLVNGLLDLAAIERGKLELQPGTHALQALIAERVEVHRARAEQKHITLACACAELPRFDFDADRIAQVLDNLLGNAIKFSPAHTQVTVRLEHADGQARVSVQDQGPGLDAAEQARLFGEFAKAGPRPSAGEKSTGLGLAIVKKVVEAHGGTVFVDSAPGRGARFGFSLPLGARAGT